MLLTACDDMHTHLYDVGNASLIEAFSGQFLVMAYAPSMRCRAWLCGALTSDSVTAPVLYACLDIHKLLRHCLAVKLAYTP